MPDALDLDALTRETAGQRARQLLGHEAGDHGC